MTNLFSRYDGGNLEEMMDEVRAAAERLLHEVAIHEEVCDCQDRPSLHHDIEIVAQAALSSVRHPAAPSADPDGGAHDGR